MKNRDASEEANDAMAQEDLFGLAPEDANHGAVVSSAAASSSSSAAAAASKPSVLLSSKAVASAIPSFMEGSSSAAAAAAAAEAEEASSASEKPAASAAAVSGVQQPSLYEASFMPQKSGNDIMQVDTPLHKTMLGVEGLANPTAPLEAAGLKITKSYVDERRYGERAIVLHNVVTLEECKMLMDLTEKVKMLDASPDHRYRCMMRAELSCTPLAKVLFARIAPFTEQQKVVSKGNAGDYNQGELMLGTWNLSGLNDHFRLCFYDGDHTERPNFGPHFDGQFAPSLNCVSLKTFMIYPNGAPDYDGGTTNFLREHDLNFDEKIQKFIAPEEAVLARLQAAPGDLLIFDHKILHEGAPVLRGKKYIFRSELMYERTGFEMSENERRAREALALAKYYEDQNDGELAVKHYKIAFKLSPELEKHT